jgi:hypothetical protein
MVDAVDHAVPEGNPDEIPIALWWPFRLGYKALGSEGLIGAKA